MNQEPLKPLHQDEALLLLKLEQFRCLSTDELRQSFGPGQIGSLKARPDGTMVDGHLAATPYWIEAPWPDRLAVVARPRGNEWLADEVDDWRQVGLDVIVSLLTRSEAIELDLEQERAQVEQQGLHFSIIQFQIEAHRLLCGRRVSLSSNFWLFLPLART